MKNRAVSLLLTACLLIFLFPTTASASDLPEGGQKESYYQTYVAIGDSICAGFTQPDYQYHDGFEMAPENSPECCYASLVGKALGSTVYNLGKCGCDTNELLNNLADSTYSNYIEISDLITLEIGSDDLLMAVVDSMLGCIEVNINHGQAMALVEPLLTGDLEGIVNCIEKITSITLSEEQIQALQNALSEAALSETLEAAYEGFCENFPQIERSICEMNPEAELVVLNYYNPYRCLNFNQEAVSTPILQLIQNYTDSMNIFTLDYCKDQDVLYADISDTITNIVDPHPSTAGHAQIAAHIIDALLNTVTASAQNGATITPSGNKIVKYRGTLEFTISFDAGSKYDVLVDGESVGQVSSYVFKDIRQNHSIAVVTASEEHPSPGNDVPSADGTTYYETYSALGDSITAGYGLCDYCGDYSDPADGYVAITAEELGTVNHYNLGLLGCDSGNLLDILTNSSNPHYAQFQSCLEKSELISIDIGSNDLTMTMLNMVLEQLGFQTDGITQEALTELIKPLLDGISSDSINEALQKYLSQKKMAPDQIAAIFNALQSEYINAKFAAAYEVFKGNWDAIIEAIRSINPDAAIAALGYYHSNPNLNIQYNGTTYYVGIGEAYQKYYDLMNTYITEESQEADNYIFVDTTGVELNSTVNTLTIDPHPSKTGHAEIAARLVDAALNQISAYASEGGTVTPQGTKTVAYGRTAEYVYAYSFKPDTGYILKDVSVDSSSVGTPESYTFSAVSEDHTITGTFAASPDQPSARTVTGIAITKEPTTISYIEGQRFNPDGMEVTASYSDGSTAVVTGYSCDPSGELKESNTAVTVTYEGQATTQAISVTVRHIPIYSVEVGSSSDLFITASAGEGGCISPSGRVSVEKGGGKTFVISANEGYFIDDVLVDGVSVGKITSYTFSNVTTAHSIQVAFSKLTDLPYYLDENGLPIFIGFASNVSGTMKYIAPSGKKIMFKQNPKSFSDIAGYWAKPNIDFVTEREIYIDTGNNAFLPCEGMTRAMLAAVLGKLYESSYGTLSPISGMNIFTDVADNTDYKTYIYWAAKNGIIMGVGRGLFEPEHNVTRQELAVILYRFAKFLKSAPEQIESTLSEYTDFQDIADWATESVLYCHNTGILIGRNDGRFDSVGIATRAEVAACLQRFIDEIVN